MRNFENQKIVRLQLLFARLALLLKNEGETNWLRAIKTISFELDRALSKEISEDEVLEYVVQTYKEIFSGNGSFSEFFIWKENFEDQLKANKELEEIKNEIWDLLFK